MRSFNWNIRIYFKNNKQLRCNLNKCSKKCRFVSRRHNKLNINKRIKLNLRITICIIKTSIRIRGEKSITIDFRCHFKISYRKIYRIKHSFSIVNLDEDRLTNIRISCKKFTFGKSQLRKCIKES